MNQSSNWSCLRGTKILSWNLARPAVDKKKSFLSRWRRQVKVATDVEIVLRWKRFSAHSSLLISLFEVTISRLKLNVINIETCLRKVCGMHIFEINDLFSYYIVWISLNIQSIHRQNLYKLEEHYDKKKCSWIISCFLFYFFFQGARNVKNNLNLY